MCSRTNQRPTWIRPRNARCNTSWPCHLKIAVVKPAFCPIPFGSRTCSDQIKCELHCVYPLRNRQISVESLVITKIRNSSGGSASKPKFRRVNQRPGSTYSSVKHVPAVTAGNCMVSWNLYQAIFVAGAIAAVSRAIPSNHKPANSEVATNGTAPGTSRRCQLYIPGGPGRTLRAAAADFGCRHRCQSQMLSSRWRDITEYLYLTALVHESDNRRTS